MRAHGEIFRENAAIDDPERCSEAHRAQQREGALAGKGETCPVATSASPLARASRSALSEQDMAVQYQLHQEVFLYQTAFSSRTPPRHRGFVRRCCHRSIRS